MQWLKHKLKSKLGVLTLALGTAACSSTLTLTDGTGQNMVGAQGIVTLVNLHPDTGRGLRLSAVNWQMPMTIPMCSEVEIQEVTKKVATIRVKETGITHLYYYHKAANEPFDQHLKRYFGYQCDKAKVAKLSKIDKKGIKDGKPYVGMSKQGIIYAMGYPPPHQTSSTDLDTWKYWKNRFDTLLIQFEKGKVTQIID
ncbi:lipoprotein [Oleiphilus messinensis]|uniref:Lipoprotein n=1 Tax=Oleiphilus messinensis TaxID=141451 RepID=A0A1Y0IFS1_9GAMM|nr:hypothetical protein [Oleiphilus messinensis]ARU58233.1 lipoprotein [Oleiphilus messinensis]